MLTDEKLAKLRTLAGLTTLSLLLCSWVHPVTAADDLPSALRLQVERFSTPGDTQFRASRQKLSSAVNKLDARLNNYRKHGTAWREFLLWNDLSATAKSSRKPNLETLDRLVERFRWSAKGLENDAFQDVAVALERYRDLVEVSENPEAKSEFAQRIEALAKTLEASEVPDAETRAAIGEDAWWLERFGGQKKLADQVRKRFSSPNLYIDASETFISRGLGRRVNEVRPIRDNILGTSISGTGRTVGQVRAKLVPRKDHAEIETYLSGTNYSCNVGHNRSAVIYTRGATQLKARQRMMLDEDGFSALTPSTWADTDTMITGIGSSKGGLMGRIVVKVASKKAPQQKPQGEYIAARHAETRLRNQFGDESGERLAEANSDYQRRFRGPLIRRGQYPQLLKFSTTGDTLRVRALQAGGERLGATGSPPTLEGNPCLSLRMHESAVNNVAFGLYAGKTVDRAEVEETSMELFDRLPDALKDEDAEEEDRDWSITFAEQDPVTLSIDDNKATITIRGKRFKSGGRSYDAMNITANYEISEEGDRIRLVRQGPLEIHPPGFKSGEDKLSVRQTVIKNRLQKRFAKIFKEELLGDGLKFKGDMKKLGTLPVSHLAADDGWISVAWR